MPTLRIELELRNPLRQTYEGQVLRQFLSLFLLIPSSSAEAASGAIYRMVWNIDQLGIATERPGVRPGDELLRINLRPPGLLQAQIDIQNPDGTILIGRGTQLVLLKSAETIACTFSDVRKSAADQLLFVGSLKRICVVDADRDGRFESTFTRATNRPAFFLLRGRLGKMRGISPVSLQSIDPKLIEGAPRLVIKLSNGSRPNATTVITTDVGNDRDPFPLTLAWKYKPNEWPATLEAYGGKLHIRPSSEGAYAVMTSGRFYSRDLDFWD